MKWRGRRGSRNIEDRRRSSGRAVKGGLGIGGLAAVLLAGWIFGIDVSPIVGGLTGGSSTQSGDLSQRDEEWGEFVSVVLADTEDVWSRVLVEQAELEYRDPKLVLFRGQVQSACGGASAAMGPFYCPGDSTIYLDTGFFDLMAEKMGAGGDFAAAYVIAHEVGHHIQNEVGVLPEVNAARARGDESFSNLLSVLTELQADCYAGIWARQAQEQFGTLEEGDLQEAMDAAHAVGDDVIQRNAGRTPMPDSFTHGSAAKRQQWLMTGFRTGDMRSCNTYADAGF